MVVVDFVSDMHIDMNVPYKNLKGFQSGDPDIFPWHLQKKSDILVIAGDNANLPAFTLATVREAKEYYPTVIWTDGNHDHYYGYRDHLATVGANMKQYREVSRDAGITYLDGKTHLRIGDTLFIGANGWYDWTANKYLPRDDQLKFWKEDSNDAKCIRFDKGGFPDKLAAKQVDMLVELVAQAQDDQSVVNIVVITHTIPHPNLAVPDTHAWGYLNGSYINMLMKKVVEADVNHKISNWLFGHTHMHQDWVDPESGIRYTNNARGYHHENLPDPFTGLMQIEIGRVSASAFGEIDDQADGSSGDPVDRTGEGSSS